jgi:hypothetical protein
MGKAGGELSVTKTSVHTAMLAGVDWPALIGQALQRDPAAIGKLVLLLGAWIGAIWGRHRVESRS